MWLYIHFLILVGGRVLKIELLLLLIERIYAIMSYISFFHSTSLLIFWHSATSFLDEKCDYTKFLPEKSQFCEKPRHPDWYLVLYMRRRRGTFLVVFISFICSWLLIYIDFSSFSVCDFLLNSGVGKTWLPCHDLAMIFLWQCKWRWSWMP